MTAEQLENLLSEMADEVKPTPMRRRVLATSKRLVMWRAITASAATLGLLSGVVVSFTAVADGGIGQAAGGDSLDGTFYEVTFDEDGDEGLASWTAGKPSRAEVIPPGTDDGMYSLSGAISPDGEYIAYMTRDVSGDNGNLIKVRDLDTGEITKVGEYSGQKKTCSYPSWAPDSKRLLVDRGSDFDDRAGFVDIEDGDFDTVDVPNPCDLRAAEGDRVYSTAKSDDGTVDVYVTDADGKTKSTGVAKVVRASSQWSIVEMGAVSPDGRFVCVGASEGYYEDLENRGNTCDLIVDTTSGKRLLGERDETVYWQGNSSMFTVPGRVVVEYDESDIDNPEEYQHMYDGEGELVGEIESTPDGVVSEEPAIGFVPRAGRG